MKAYFTLDNPKRDKSTIRGFIHYSGTKYKYPTGESIKTSMFVNQKCKASPEASGINNKLMAVKSAMESAILFFKQDFKTPAQKEFQKKVEAFLAGNNAIEIKNNEKLLIAYIEEYIENSLKSERTKTGYRTTLNILRKYESNLGRKVRFSDVDLKFDQDLTKWLILRGESKNYIWFIFKNIKLFMGSAMDIDKLHQNNDYVKFEHQPETADTIALNEDELRRIHNLKITDELIRSERKDARIQNIHATVEALTRTKNKFLIGAFCTMRISDFNRINEMNIHGDVIKIMPIKGSSLRKPEPIEIPMHEVVKEVVESGFDFNVKMSDQKFNEHIKEVCRLAGIDERIVYYRTVGGELREYVAKKYEKVTSHTARRSGATNMYLADMPIELIMACGGWQKREQCEKYIKASVNEKLQKLKESGYFIGWQKQMDITEIDSDWVRIQMAKKKISVRDLSDKIKINEAEIEDVLKNGLNNWQKAVFFQMFSRNV